MSTFMSQGKRDDQLLFDLSQKKISATRIPAEKSKKRTSGGRGNVTDLKFDGL